MNDLTQLLQAWSAGDESALAQLVPFVERELHQLARAYMAKERRDHTLQATALVNEVFLRLVRGAPVQWKNRAQFVGIAARIMRRVLVDHARARGYQKRGGGGERVPLDEDVLVSTGHSVDLVALDRALEGLGVVDARKSQVVELRFFGGLGVAETAAVLGVSEDTVKRDWRIARLWLLRELRGDA